MMKFKSKLAARVKFKALAAFTKAVSQNVSAERSRNVSQALACTLRQISQNLLASRSRIASSNAVVGWIVNLNYKELDEAKFKIPPPKREKIKAPRSAPLGRFEAPPAYQACFFALRNRPK